MRIKYKLNLSRLNRTLGCVTSVTICLAVTCWLSACEIPVFRYALERWDPDPYVAVVLHDGPLDEEHRLALDRLRASRVANGGGFNIDVRTVDVSQTLGNEDRAILRGFDLPQKLPHLWLQYPIAKSSMPLAWQTPFSAEAVEQLISSPARTEVIDRILKGDSAVWVLLESGDPQKDAQAAKTMETELARLNMELQLPPPEVIEQDPAFRPNTKVDLILNFSLLKISRDDLRDAAFRSILLGMEQGLADSDHPVAVPIFGRGRALFARKGESINRENIEDDCRFMAGDCSCLVKEQNPGIDLPLDVVWDDHVTFRTELDNDLLPELTGLGVLERDETLQIRSYTLSEDRINQLSMAPPANQASDPKPGPDALNLPIATGSASPPDAAPAATYENRSTDSGQATDEPEALGDSVVGLPVILLAAVMLAVVGLGLMTLLRNKSA